MGRLPITGTGAPVLLPPARPAFIAQKDRQMKLSICTDVMADLSFTDMLDRCVELGVEGLGQQRQDVLADR